jgi:hypothetical protein
MNNINIKNIFCNPNNTNDFNNGIESINVYNLVPNEKQSSELTDDYILNKIINNNLTEIKKTDELYELKYKECLLKINDAINIEITDIYFTVPINFFGYKKYNPKKCLEFIQKKLRNKKFETFIISNTSIFISWKNV